MTDSGAGVGAAWGDHDNDGYLDLYLAFTVEASADLMNWSPLGSATNETGTLPFSDPAPAPLPQQFYRVQGK